MAEEKEEAVEELILPEQEIILNEGTFSEEILEPVSEITQSEDVTGLDYLKRIESKLNRVLEVIDDGKTNN